MTFKLRLILTVLISFLIVGVAGPASAWVPASCTDRGADIEAMRQRAGAPPGHVDAWASYREAILAAQPGDPKYVPHPYPESDDEVFENFRYTFLNRLVQDPENVAPHRRSTFEALRGEGLSYRVHRVENWQLGRCRMDHTVPFYYLIQLFQGSEEVSRAAIYENGLWSHFSPEEGEGWPVEDLGRVEQLVEERFGVKLRPGQARQAQLVVTDGLPLQCHATLPCVAFRAEGEIYLVNRDAYLYVIEPDAPALRVPDFARRPVPPRGGDLSGRPLDQRWVSVGYGFREARLAAVGSGGQGPG